jgi:hypothetical protein
MALKPANSEKKNTLDMGRRRKPPGAIAPEFLALFAEVEQPRRRAFLAAYVQEGGNFLRTKRRARASKHYDWVRGDAVYRAAFERAKRMVADAAERAVVRRARGMALSNARLRWILRSFRPESYAGSGKKSE